jgi:hypothetical protein
MKRAILFVAVALLVSVGIARAGSMAGSGDPFIFNFDENGNGQSNDNGAGLVTNNGTLMPDPTQSGNPMVLTFMLPELVVTGDVKVWEDFIGGTLGDALRFTNAAGDLSGGLVGDRMIFYSLSGGPDLADTGLPATFFNPGNAIENVGGTFTYAPGGAGDNIYNGTSDGSLAVPSAVPAPASALAGLTLLTILGVWRKWRSRSATN